MPPYTVRTIAGRPRRVARTRPGRLGIVAAGAAIVAGLPYAGLKVAWLLGSSVGSTSAEEAAELHDARHVAGNLVTLGMEACVVLLALALVRPWGRRMPAALILAPVWLGTGLLAPVALGLPVGVVAQALAGGSSAPADGGLQGWVYALVYGGFTVQALALGTAFVLHVRARWPDVLAWRGQRSASSTLRRDVALAAGASAAALYGVANLGWALAPDRLSAPAGFDTVAQRSLLVSTGVLAAGAAIAALMLGRRGDRPGIVVVLVWVGSATCFASGFAQYGLAADGDTRPATVAVLVLGSAAGALMAGGVLWRDPLRPDQGPGTGRRARSARRHVAR